MASRCGASFSKIRGVARPVSARLLIYHLPTPPWASRISEPHAVQISSLGKPHTILYARVSTAEQTLDHQRTQAERSGFKIDEVVADDGVSGVSTRLCERKEGKRLYDKLREGDVLVVRWVDRLGRNYADVTEVIRHFIQRGVVIRTVINNMTFDGATSDPMQMAVRDALIAFLAATAQAQAEATREAQQAGIFHAKGNPQKYRGRKPTYTREQVDAVLEMLGTITNVTEVADRAGLSRQTVLRIKESPENAYARIGRWD